MIKKRKVTLRITQSMMIDIGLLCSQYEVSRTEFLCKSIKAFNKIADYVGKMKTKKNNGKYRCNLTEKKDFYIPADCEFRSCELRNILAWNIKQCQSVNAKYADNKYWTSPISGDDKNKIENIDYILE